MLSNYWAPVLCCLAPGQKLRAPLYPFFTSAVAQRSGVFSCYLIFINVGRTKQNMIFNQNPYSTKVTLVKESLWPLIKWFIQVFGPEWTLRTDGTNDILSLNIKYNWISADFEKMILESNARFCPRAARALSRWQRAGRAFARLNFFGQRAARALDFRRAGGH